MECNLTLFHDVKVITHIALTNDPVSFIEFLDLHCIDESKFGTVVDGVKNKIIS